MLGTSSRWQHFNKRHFEFFAGHICFCVQLLKTFEECFPDVNFPPVPDRGNFELKEVLRAPYFFN